MILFKNTIALEPGSIFDKGLIFETGLGWGMIQWTIFNFILQSCTAQASDVACLSNFRKNSDSKNYKYLLFIVPMTYYIMSYGRYVMYPFCRGESKLIYIFVLFHPIFPWIMHWPFTDFRYGFGFKLFWFIYKSFCPQRKFRCSSNLQWNIMFYCNGSKTLKLYAYSHTCVLQA